MPGWASCRAPRHAPVPHVDPATDAWPGHWHPLYLLVLAGYAPGGGGQIVPLGISRMTIANEDGQEQ